MRALEVVLERGGTSESEHIVDGIVVHHGSGDVRVFGNPDVSSFWRSSMKPFQSLPAVNAKVLPDLGLGEEALALACASHHGTPAHTAVVDSMLAAMSLGADALACGAHRPVDEESARALDAAGRLPGRIHNNCSGKHAAMLALSQECGWSLEGYHESAHPLQVVIRQELGRWIESDPDVLSWGVDGCGVPTPSLPLREMAHAYARFGVSDEAGPRAVVSAMTKHPNLVSGRTAFSSNLMSATGGRVLGKEGAEGVFCVACPGSAWGAAFKVRDGAMRALGPAVLRGLERLDLIGAAELDRLQAFVRVSVQNTREEEVASLSAVKHGG